MAPRSAALLFLALACGGSPSPDPAAAGSTPSSSPLADHDSDARADADAASDPPPTGRLGDAVQPRAVSLELRLDPREPGFRGRVTIDLAITRPVSAIWLDARELELERARLTVGSRELDLRAITPSPPGRLGLVLGQKTGPGPARLVIDYTGRFGARNGLFRQRVEDRWYAFTDFEAADARLAVPCFDDPRFKIPWQVTLVHPAGMRSFANAPEARTVTAERGWQRVEFAATPPIPSYLVAFAVGPFDVLDGPRRPVPIRVVTTRGRATLGAEALRIAPAMLAELERYLGSRTPFPKLDLLAVPTFNGAMENPGLITFADPILLLDWRGRDTDAWRDRQRFMAGVMAHELAHLWFGDLVTMSWWNELWLNEGIATFMSDRVIAATDPARRGLVADVVDKRLGLAIDRGRVDTPVRAPITRLDDIEGQFSPLVYRKGGAILAMFEAYLGEERTRDALRRYLAASARGSVTSTELAAALSAGAGRDLRPALESFLDQPGVPLVEAALECRGRPTVTLRQSAYAALGNPAPARRWQVPVCVAWEGGAAPACTLLRDQRGAIELPAARCPSWIHPNPGERGYYVYALPPAQLRALAALPGLTARERAGLADDIGALLGAGRVDLAAALDAFWSLARARDTLTDTRAAQALTLVGRALVGPGQRRAFAARLRSAYGARAERLGLSPRAGESPFDAELREVLVPLVGRDGDDRVLQREALRRLRDALDQRTGQPDPITAAEYDLLYRLGPLAADQAMFDRLLQDGRGHAARALSGFRRPALVARALDAVDKDRLGPAESLDLLGALVRDGATQDAALPVALRVYPFLAARVADTVRNRSAAVLAGACRTAARPGVESALRQALAPRGQLPAQARAAIDEVSACGAFRDHYAAAAATYFR
ncbi:MAG TPA: M1 family aminopeptidase [Kofleriaceae bacterium]|nr:M1 family aminopeptidase [Kofleriaceae bacterium]